MCAYDLLITVVK